MFRNGLTCLLALADVFGENGLKRRQQYDEPPTPDPDVDEVFDKPYGLNLLNDMGLADLPRPQWTSTKWAAGALPESCYLYTQEPDMLEGTCPPSEMEVYSVTYDDCSDPWIICRCGDATGDTRQMMNMLGQIPVGAREYIRYVVMAAEHDSAGAAAISQAGDLVVFGESASVSLLVHEVSHIIDLWEFGQDEQPYSYSQEWLDAVDDETCVAAEYAKTTYTEAYAETAIMVAYDVNVEPISEIVDYGCMEGSFNIVKEQMGDLFRYDEDATCHNRMDEDQRVCLDSSGQTLECDEQQESESETPWSDSEQEPDAASEPTGSGAADDESSARPRVSLGEIPLLVFRGVAWITNVKGGRRA